MPWTCRLVPQPTFDEDADGKNGYQRLRVGDMWWVDPMPTDADHLSTVVCRVKHAGKRALIVRLPGPVDFAVYGPTWGGGKQGPGWDVSGEAPAVTVSPSIHVHGVYHGYLRNGVIEDEIEGRKYNDDGALIRTGQRG